MINRASVIAKVARHEAELECLKVYQFDLDKLVRKCSAFEDFDDLINAQGNYRPSLDVGDFMNENLADWYDKVQEGRGDDRRAYRYGDSHRELYAKHGIGEVFKDPKESKRYMWKVKAPWGLQSFSTRKAARAFVEEANEADMFNPENFKKRETA